MAHWVSPVAPRPQLPNWMKKSPVLPVAEVADPVLDENLEAEDEDREFWSALLFSSPLRRLDQRVGHSNEKLTQRHLDPAPDLPKEVLPMRRKVSLHSRGWERPVDQTARRPWQEKDEACLQPMPAKV